MPLLWGVTRLITTTARSLGAKGAGDYYRRFYMLNGTIPQDPKEKQPLRCGDWYFDAKILTLEYVNGRWNYQIDLEECTTPAELLDWLFQIQGKSWCTPEVLYDLFELLEAVSKHMLGTSVQGAFCPFCKSRTVAWSQPTRATTNGRWVETSR